MEETSILKRAMKHTVEVLELATALQEHLDKFEVPVRGDALAWVVASMTHEVADDPEDAKQGLAAFSQDAQDYLDALNDDGEDDEDWPVN